MGFGNRENFQRITRLDLHARRKINVQVEVFVFALEMNHPFAFNYSLTAIPEPYCSGNQRQHRQKPSLHTTSHSLVIPNDVVHIRYYINNE